MPRAPAERIIAFAKTFLEPDPSEGSIPDSHTEEVDTTTTEIVDETSEAESAKASTEADTVEEGSMTESDESEETMKADEPEAVADLLEGVDRCQLANHLVQAIVQNPGAMRQIAKEVSSELAQILGKRLCKQLAQETPP